MLVPPFSQQHAATWMGDIARSRSPLVHGGIATGDLAQGSAGIPPETVATIKSVLDSLWDDYSKGLVADVQARNRTLFDGFDAEMQKRLDNHDNAITSIKQELLDMRQQQTILLDTVQKLSQRLGLAEAVENTVVAQALEVAEWDRTPFPNVVSVSAGEASSKEAVMAGVQIVLAKAQLQVTSVELVGAPQSKFFDLIFTGATGTGGINAKRFLNAVKDGGKWLKVYIPGTTIQLYFDPDKAPKIREQEAQSRKLNRVLTKWSESMANGIVYRLNRRECEVSAGGIPLVRVRAVAPQSCILEWNDAHATSLQIDKLVINTEFLKDPRPAAAANISWSRG